jgi:hypothetical protein
MGSGAFDSAALAALKSPALCGSLFLKSYHYLSFVASGELPHCVLRLKSYNKVRSRQYNIFVMAAS